MPDKEKIMQALEQHEQGMCIKKDIVCPYWEHKDCVSVLCKDVLAILREKENVCSAYHIEWGNSVCWGTKEREVCSCGGNKAKCNFYSLVN